MEQNDSVNHPAHYNHGKFECADVILDWKLNYLIGNAVKYLCRYEYKKNPIEDLKKAIWYIQKEIDTLEKNSINYKPYIDYLNSHDEATKT